MKKNNKKSSMNKDINKKNCNSVSNARENNSKTESNIDCK